MPGLEKRLVRYSEFYSRIGFVHEFRPLGVKEIHHPLDRCWTSPCVQLPQHPLGQETMAAIIRITGGNFRLVNRLLTQMDRILEINSLQQGGRGSRSRAPGNCAVLLAERRPATSFRYAPVSSAPRSSGILAVPNGG
jgi:hypothetical protein